MKANPLSKIPQNRRTLLLAGAGIVLVIALMTGVLVLGGGDDGGDGKAKDPAAVAVTDPADSPYAEPAPPDSEPSEEATVKPQAEKLSGAEITPNPKITAPLPDDSLPPYATGCDYSYGDGKVCVPWAFPADYTTAEDKCAYLFDQGLLPLNSKGADRHGLDPDKNGTICDGGLTPLPPTEDPL